MTVPSTGTGLIVLQTNPTFVGAITITGGTVTASTPLSFTQTWNNGAVQFFGIKLNITDTASLTASELLSLQVGGSDRVTILKSGEIQSVSNIAAGANRQFYWVGRSALASSSDGLITASNNAGTGFTGLILGTNDVSGIRVKKNSTAFNLRLGDDSADAAVTAAAGTFSGLITANAGVTVSSSSLTVSGSISAPAWTTNGIRYVGSPATLTDTTSTGTVAAAYSNAHGGSTIAASNAVTYTRYYGSYFTAPVAGANVTFTNRSALGADSISIGGAAQSTYALAVTGTANISGATTLGGALTYGGVTLNNAVTGTGNMVLSAGPTFTGTLAAATLTTSGTFTASNDIRLNNNLNLVLRTAAAGNGILVSMTAGDVGQFFYYPATNVFDFGTISTSDLRFNSNNTVRGKLTSGGNWVFGNAALATNATDGFLYLPTSAGTPTGVPTAYTGMVAHVYDTTNNKLYVYNGAWKATAALT